MERSLTEIYRKRRELALDFIRDSMVAELHNPQMDEEYFAALTIVKKKVNTAIAREGKGDKGREI